MIWVIFGILVIVAGILAFLNFKTWKIFHVLVLFLVFIGTFGMCLLAALVLRTEAAWKKAYEDTVASLQQAENEKQLLVAGDPQSENPIDSSSRASISQSLRRTVDERGRVWRNCTLTSAGQTIQLSTVPEGVDPGTAAPNRITVNSKLVAFKEDVVADKLADKRVPIIYLGEYLVTAATDTSVTLKPTTTIDPERDADQINQINDRNGTWVLYEKMPIDGHKVFQAMTLEQLQEAFPRQATQTDEQYEEMLDQYRYDEQSLEKIKGEVAADPNRINKVFDPSPQRQWVWVEYVENDEIEVNGEVVAGALLTSNAFDASGRAQQPRLIQRNKDGEPYPTKVGPGDKVLFDSATAEQKIAEGKARLEDRVFRRELNDYEYIFHEIERRRLEMLSRLAAVQRDNADIKNSIDNVKKQIAFRSSEIEKLRDDLANHNEEIKGVVAYRQKLERDWAALKDSIIKSYAANKYYETQIVAMQQQLSDAVESRIGATLATESE